jgi:hypothetical protein
MLDSRTTRVLYWYCTGLFEFHTRQIMLVLDTITKEHHSPKRVIIIYRGCGNCTLIQIVITACSTGKGFATVPVDRTIVLIQWILLLS